MDYENILVEHPAPGVGLVKMNQPRAFNTLSGPMLDDVMSALEAMNADETIGCMVLTGTDRVFAGGRGHQRNVAGDAARDD